MCQPKENLKFCTCGQKVKRKTFWNKLFNADRHKGTCHSIPQLNCWTLYAKDNERDVDGEMMLPEDAQELRKNLHDKYDYVVDQLNATKDCFDFDYHPQLEDELVINLDGSVFTLVFDEKWYLKTFPGSLNTWEFWELVNGKVRKEQKSKAH